MPSLRNKPSIIREPPRKAILLAAGFGSRMAPLSHDLPKPVMPLWGRPVIEHAIHQLWQVGVTDFLINLHHHPQPLLDWFRQRLPEPSIHVQFSYEPQILGTGGALRRAEHFLDGGPLWIVNTDIAFDLDLSFMTRDFYQNRPLATLWMHDGCGPRTVKMSEEGGILDFATDTPGVRGTFTFCGIQIADPQILDHLPPRPFCSIVDGYRCALKEGLKVRGCCVPDAFWADLGTPERYLEAHRDIAQAYRRRKPGRVLFDTPERRRMRRAIPKDSKVIGFAAIGRNVNIGSNCTLDHAILWEGASVSPGCCIRNSIAGCGAAVKNHLDGNLLIRTATLPPDPVMAAALNVLHIPHQNAMLSVLPARGSDRSFERLSGCGRSGILIRYDDRRRPENARYAAIAQALKKAGIRVPDVRMDMPERKALLLEDAGALSLQDALPGMSRRTRIFIYRHIINLLLLLHRTSRHALPPLEPAFSRELYRWEHDLFCEHFLANTLKVPPETISLVRKQLEPAARSLLKQPFVPVHRDMQSSNILLQKGRPVLIDFQGLRMGAAAYDLASLLCDPYAKLDAEDRRELLEAYCSQVPGGDAIQDAFPAAVVQRLSQALGAFGRLAAMPGTRRFSRYMAPACALLCEHLSPGVLFDILKANRLDCYSP